jgi:hypothetical protein
MARRAERFISQWRSGTEPLVVACSHGDWLPVALQAATGARASLKKGGWAEIRLEPGKQPELRWLLQGFRKR